MDTRPDPTQLMAPGGARSRSGRTLLRTARLTGSVLSAVLVLSGQPALAASDPRARAIIELASGRPAPAQAVADSLLRADLSDLTAAYVGARAAEEAGEIDGARCRYLELERVAPGQPVARLAADRRRSLEARHADHLVAEARRGDAEQPSERAAVMRDLVLLLPLENLGEAEPGAGFGLSWTFLLDEALRGTELCPVGLPAMLAAQDQAAGALPRRIPEAVRRFPVNSLAGLDARLAALPGREGRSYLAIAGADSAAIRKDALLAFQRDHGLVPSGEADRETQRALESALERWVDEPPAPLAPEAVPRAMRQLGAGLALRGTYVLEGDRARVQFGWIDLEGREVVAAVSRTFPVVAAREEVRAAALDLLRRRGGDSHLEGDRISLEAAALRTLTDGLLLDARGAGELAARRWEGLERLVDQWPRAREVRTAWQLDEARLREIELHLLNEWARGPIFDPRREVERFVDHFGIGSPSVDPNAVGVLGTFGILDLEIEGP
ncbi:MAG: peptidoglycan-binding protein [Candidatus Eisenbacteria bacterium]|nr:peptidoglycan-binding protein [Candidatus Eisenbacteria bacterium]